MDRIHKEYASVFDMMLEWYEAWKKDQEDESDLDGYLEWKLGYPHPSKKECLRQNENPQAGSQLFQSFYRDRFEMEKHHFMVMYF